MRCGPGSSRGCPMSPRWRRARRSCRSKTNSVAAVLVAQAFHWFANEAALTEFHRVLEPTGALGLIWNRRCPEDPLQAAISELIEPYSPGVPRHASDTWRQVIGDSRLFDATGSFQLAFVQELDADGLVDRVGSTSFIAALADDERSDLLDRVRALVGSAKRARLSYTCEAFAFGHALNQKSVI